MPECPWGALRDPTLPDGCKTVLTVLWRKSRRRGPLQVADLEPACLASDAGMHSRTWRRHMAALRARGWIESSHGIVILWVHPVTCGAETHAAQHEESLPVLLRRVADRLEVSDG